MDVFFLTMRKDNGVLKAGTPVDVFEAMPDGKCPEIGRVPLMDEGDGHPYGGMHTIIKVSDFVTYLEAELYLERKPNAHPYKEHFDKNIPGDHLNPNYDPTIPKGQRKYMLDLNLMPGNRKVKHEGKKPKKYSDKYDTIFKKPKKDVDVEDDVMTKAEFDSFLVVN